MLPDKIRYFFPKVFNRFWVEKNSIWRHLPLEKISLCGMGKSPSAEKLKERLNEMFGNLSDVDFSACTDEEKKAILECANNTLSHEFNLLGSGIVKNDPVKWNIDIKTGYEWPQPVYYKQMPKYSAGSDIKMPWELSRCHHLLWLGEAYNLTTEAEYAAEVSDEISQWIECNPLMYTVNWTCAMDVAIRAVNWMYALWMIQNSEFFDDALAAMVYKSLHQHGFFIVNNIERSIPNSNNHYLSDIAGLLYLGLFFSNTGKGRSWRKLALKEYCKEVRRQVLPSGVNYERSVSYHRLTTELCLYPLMMLDRVGVKVYDDVRKLAYGMQEYVSNYTKPNGYAPLIADNDDGRFLPFVKRNMRCHSYLNDTGSLEMRIISNGTKAYYVSGNKISKLYADANIAIIRHEDAYLFVNGGGYAMKPNPSAKSVVTHTHNDALSFEISIGKQDLVIDPGTYVYTSSIENRNEFRSTAKHNTVIVDGEEQNELSKAAFLLGRNIRYGALKMEDGMVHGNYSTINGGLKHNREFRVESSSLLIKDVLHKDGDAHNGVIRFHLAEGIDPRISDRKAVFIIEGYNVEISNPDCRISVEDDTWSPSYGVLENNKTLSLSFDFDNSIELATTIRWQKKSTMTR